MKRRVAIAAGLVLLSSGPARPCIPVSRDTVPIAVAQEEAVIAYDSRTGTERFIRKGGRRQGADRGIEPEAGGDTSRNGDTRRVARRLDAVRSSSSVSGDGTSGGVRLEVTRKVLRAVSVN